MIELQANSNATAPAIPVVYDVTPPELYRLHPRRALALLEAGRALYGPRAFAIGDRLSRAWAMRNGLPYRQEIDEIARDLRMPGAWLLNLSFEWGCSTGVMPAAGGKGAMLLRTLDWPLRGLGREVVVARHQGPAGPWFNVTWPGFVGATTGLAPGRFAAALNQAPMRTSGLGAFGDWVANRLRVWFSRALPPAVLLRRAFDECASFDEAVEMLAETPICLPVIYTIAGPTPDRGVVIERLEKAAYRHPAPVCVTNHWLTPGLDGVPRSSNSPERLDFMRGHMAASVEGFVWLQAPVLNDATRIAVTANAATGELVVQGWENGEPATSVLRLVA